MWQSDMHLFFGLFCGKVTVVHDLGGRKNSEFVGSKRGTTFPANRPIFCPGYDKKYPPPCATISAGNRWEMSHMTLYLDVLLLTEWLANYLSLRLMMQLGGYDTRQLRCLLAALMGAAYGAVVAVWGWGQWLRIPMSLLMVWLATGWRGRYAFARQILLFYLASGLLCGGVLVCDALFFRRNGAGAAFGIITVHGGFLALLAELGLSYQLILLAAAHIKSEKRRGKQYIMLTMVRGNRMCELKGLVDTGNDLTDPVSHDPVVVTDYPSIRALFSDEEQQALYMLLRNRYADLPAVCDFRLLHYHTVGSPGKTMPAFRPDEFYLLDDGVPKRIRDVVVGISDTRVSSDGRYQVLLQMQLVNQPEEGAEQHEVEKLR